MNKHQIIRALLYAESIFSFGIGLFLPIFAIFSTQIGGDILDAGIAAGIFILVTSILERPIGRLLDRYHEKYFIVADYFIEGIVFISYMYIDNMYELFVLQVLLGIANAIGDPAWESLYDKMTPKEKSGSYWANSHFYTGILNGIGVILGSYIVLISGFRWVFFVGAMASFLAGSISLRYLPKS